MHAVATSLAQSGAQKTPTRFMGASGSVRRGRMCVEGRIEGGSEGKEEGGRQSEIGREGGREGGRARAGRGGSERRKE